MASETTVSAQAAGPTLFSVEDLENALQNSIIQSFFVSAIDRVSVFIRGIEKECPFYSQRDNPVLLCFPQKSKTTSSSIPPFPEIRFTEIIRHSMISEIGLISPPVRYQIKQDWKSRKDNQLLYLLKDLQQFLTHPFYLTFPDDLIDELTEGIHDECQCCGAPADAVATHSPHHNKEQLYAAFRAAQKRLSDDQFEKWGTLHLNRLNTISEYRAFGPHMPELFHRNVSMNESWFDPRFLDPHLDIQEDCPHVYSFPFFTPAFCQSFMKEIARFRASGLYAAKPNSMNNYGVVLDDIGLEHFISRLIELFLRNIAEKLFPDVGNSLDSHHSFVVEYAPEGDKDLDMHIDDSEVTFNINLDDQFSGSSLIFCGMFNSPSHRKHSATYQHQLGRCVVHRGIQRHGAATISGGSRTNLIIWCRSSSHRIHNHLTPDPEANAVQPDIVCLSRIHDPDYSLHLPPNSK